jgi:dipeptidyl aminopeptidase/acylaminoacyl peptidase
MRPTEMSSPGGATCNLSNYPNSIHFSYFQLNNYTPYQLNPRHTIFHNHIARIAALIILVHCYTFSALPPLIKTKVLFGNMEKTNPHLSHDGKHLAFIAPVNGVMNLWVRTLATGKDTVVSKETTQGISDYVWAEDNEHLVYFKDKNGDQQYHLYSIDIFTKTVIDLIPHDGVTAQVIQTNRYHPGTVLAAMNERDKNIFDMYALDVTAPRESLVVQNPGDVIAWTADSNLIVRAALAQTRDGGYALRTRADANAAWKQIAAWTAADGMPSILAFGPDNRHLYMQDARSWPTKRLVSLDIESGADTVLAFDSSYDADQVMINPRTHVAEAVSFASDRDQWRTLGRNYRHSVDFARIGSAYHAEFNIIDRDWNDSLWLIGYFSDMEPTEFALYGPSMQEPIPQFSELTTLEKYKLTPMSPFTFQSRDSITLHAFMTMPEGVDPDSLPLVVLVHDGPWARDMWGMNYTTQWLANRGYAVLQVDYRGSTGYGEKFIDMGDREWGAKMQNDLEDGVKYMVDQGLVNPSNVAIMGESYGGYAVLAGAAFTPSLYKCGVEMCGPGDLAAYVQAFPATREPEKKFLESRLGNAALLKSRSPLFSAEKISIPLLIGQGANDPIVNKSQSDAIVGAIKNKANIQYMLFPDEGHCFMKAENRLKFYEAADKFLHEQLGGRTDQE